MTDIGRQIARVEEAIPTVRRQVGTFVSASNGVAYVDFPDGGGRVPVSWAVEGIPTPGTRVHCVYIDGGWLLLGPVAPAEKWGRILSVPSEGVAVVEYPPGSGVSKQMEVPKGQTAAANDLCTIEWSRGGTIVSLYGTVAAPPVSTTPPPAVSRPVQTRDFAAYTSGTSTNAGYWLSWTTDLYTRNTNGSANFGVWFYNSIKDNIAASQAVTRAQLYMPLKATGSQFTIGYHTLTGKAGTPVIQAGVLQQPVNGWIDLPPSIADALKAGGPGVGIVISGGAGTIVHGVGADGQSGLLRLTYQ